MFWMPNSPIKIINDVTQVNKPLGKQSDTRLSDMPEFENLLPNFSGIGEGERESFAPPTWDEVRSSYAPEINQDYIDRMPEREYWRKPSGGIFDDPMNIAMLAAAGLILYLILKD